MVGKGIQHQGFHGDDVTDRDFTSAKAGECGCFDGGSIVNFECDVKCSDGC